MKNSRLTEQKIGERLLCLNSEMQIKKDLEGNILQFYIKTTPGRILLNQAFEDN